MAFVLNDSLQIEAPVARVWEVITDLDRYPEWNPFVPRAQSTLHVGDPIVMHVHISQAFTQPQREFIFEHVSHERLCYGIAPMPLGALRSHRCHLLAPRDDHTDYRSTFLLDGWLAPATRRLLGSRMQQGFTAMANALKARAEQLEHAPAPARRRRVARPHPRSRRR